MIYQITLSRSSFNFARPFQSLSIMLTSTCSLFPLGRILRACWLGNLYVKAKKNEETKRTSTSFHLYSFGTRLNVLLSHAEKLVQAANFSSYSPKCVNIYTNDGFGMMLPYEAEVDFRHLVWRKLRNVHVGALTLQLWAVLIRLNKLNRTLLGHNQLHPAC